MERSSSVYARLAPWLYFLGGVAVTILLVVIANLVLGGIGTDKLSKIQHQVHDIVKTENVEDVAEAKCCMQINGTVNDIDSRVKSIGTTVNHIDTRTTEIAVDTDDIIAITTGILTWVDNQPPAPFICAPDAFGHLPPPNAKVLTPAMLPYTVTTPGETLVLQSNITWTHGPFSGFALVIEATGVSLYGCGYSFIMTANGRLIDVKGFGGLDPNPTGVIGELNIFGIRVVAPTPQYTDLARGIASVEGGTVRVYDLHCTNMYRCIQAFGGICEVHAANITRIDELNDETRIHAIASGAYLDVSFGIQCIASACITEGVKYFYGRDAGPNGTADYNSTNGATGYGAGIKCDDNPAGMPWTQAAMCIVRDCRLQGTEPLVLFSSNFLSVDNVYAKTISVIPPRDPAYPPQNLAFGVRLGCDRPATGFVNRLTVDATDNNEWGGYQLALYLLGTHGLTLTNVEVFGQSPFTRLQQGGVIDGIKFPRIGLVTIEPTNENLFAPQYFFDNLIVRATHPDTLNVVMGAYVTGKITGCQNTYESATFKNSQFSDGKVGLLIGPGSKRGIRVDASKFTNNEIGVLIQNNATAVSVRDNQFVGGCDGVAIGTGASSVILRNNDYFNMGFDVYDPAVVGQRTNELTNNIWGGCSVYIPGLLDVFGHCAGNDFP